MTDITKNYLQYIRASIADASRLMPNLQEDSIEITFQEIQQGKLFSNNTKKLFDIQKRRNKKSWENQDDEQISSIEIIVCPRVYSVRPEHGQGKADALKRVAPVFVFANLGQDGEIYVYERDNTPIIPRNLLEPTIINVVIGSVEDADTAYALLPDDRNSWVKLLQAADELVQRVTEKSLDELKIDQYECLDYGVISLYPKNFATWHISRLVDLALDEKDSHHRLFEHLLSEKNDKSLELLDKQLSASTLHLGQMQWEYELSPSQREALLHFFCSDGSNSGVLAVDGPPGTGKTTLLLSVIASLWVQNALAEGDAPLIVASSTNNQAILNILESFAKVKEKELPFAGRWLKNLKSYGLYMPAKIRENDEFSFPVHVLRGDNGGEAIHDAQHFESLEGLQIAKTHFFECFEKEFGSGHKNDLKKASKIIHARIQQAAEKVINIIRHLQVLSNFVSIDEVDTDQLERLSEIFLQEKIMAEEQRASKSLKLEKVKLLRRDWLQYTNNAPLWIRFLYSIGVRGPRNKQDQLFTANAVLQFSEILEGVEFSQYEREQIEIIISTLASECERERTLAQTQAETAAEKAKIVSAAYQALKVTVSDSDNVSFQTVQSALDIGPRYEAFKLSTHYWEARYLLEVEETLQRAPSMEDTKSPKALERQYRRLAKLFPCFVTTLYNLPKKFIGYNQRNLPLFGRIDLLIIDEAGQVLPEIGAPSFLLAKRALVVGDVDQLEPIWNIPQVIDGPNALKFDVVESEAELEEFIASGMAASSGSLMKFAQRATSYAKHPKRGRGLFLSEHRRCLPSIIRICNALVYQGLLEPKRPEDERKFVPTLGYAHIPGTDQRSGKSRYNLTEASAIAKWLKQRKEEIESIYAEEGKKLAELVAVITPFAAQLKTVKAALCSELGVNHGITVGTVHSLQGAERRIIIFSPTYGLNNDPGTTFFDRNKSILNVAVSRAQDSLLVFGNMHLFRPVGSHPSAVLGKFLFQGGDNELSDIPAELLCLGLDSLPSQLIRDLRGHRAVLEEAFASARTRVVVVSPYLTVRALDADEIPNKIRAAVNRGVRVSVITDGDFNKNRSDFAQCIELLRNAGARVELAQSQSVHSKLLLVDLSWLAIGSFNWLSAVRDESSDWCRYETSLRYDGVESFQMISQTLRDLKKLIGM